MMIYCFYIVTVNCRFLIRYLSAFSKGVQHLPNCPIVNLFQLNGARLANKNRCAMLAAARKL